MFATKIEKIHPLSVQKYNTQGWMQYAYWSVKYLVLDNRINMWSWTVMPVIILQNPPRKGIYWVITLIHIFVALGEGVGMLVKWVNTIDKEGLRLNNS